MQKKISLIVLLLVIFSISSTVTFSKGKSKSHKKSTKHVYKKVASKKIKTVKNTSTKPKEENYKIVDEAKLSLNTVTPVAIINEKSNERNIVETLKVTETAIYIPAKIETNSTNSFEIKDVESNTEKTKKNNIQLEIDRAVKQAILDSKQAETIGKNIAIANLDSKNSENENKDKDTVTKEAVNIGKSYECIAEILTDEHGEVLTGRNIDYIHPIASLTKMMTALLTLEKVKNGEIDYDTLVTVPKEATLLGESSSGLRAGEKVKIEDLLKCAIVKSGNDAAYTLGKFIGGTEEEFVIMMNKKAKMLNMGNTTYYTSCGLPAKYYQKAKIAPLNRDYDTSTVADIGKLASEIIKYPKYLEISSQYLMKVKDGKIKLRNRNSLVAKYEGVDGLKTGYHTKAHYNIAVSSKKDGVRLIAIVFGSPTLPAREAEVIRLLDTGYENLGIAKLEKKHTIM